jgi:hypothetical protein
MTTDPELADFAARAMRAQQAVDAVVSDPETAVRALALGMRDGERLQTGAATVDQIVAERQADPDFAAPIVIDSVRTGDTEHVIGVRRRAIDPETPVTFATRNTWTCACGVQLPRLLVDTLVRVAQITMQRHANATVGAEPIVPLYCLECGRFVGWNRAPEPTELLWRLTHMRWWDLFRRESEQLLAKADRADLLDLRYEVRNTFRKISEATRNETKRKVGAAARRKAAAAKRATKRAKPAAAAAKPAKRKPKRPAKARAK